MLAYLISGVALGFAASVQPGPLATYLVAQSLNQGWRRTLPAAFAPMVSDGPIAVLALLALSHVPAHWIGWLRLAGGVFVLYLAYGAWKSWRRHDPVQAPGARTGRRSLFRATAVNLLNPGPYIGWSLVLGPLVLKGWRDAPIDGVAAVAGFYGTMVIGLAGIICLFGLARAIGPKVNRALIGLSAAALAGFGAYQIWLWLASFYG